MEEIQSNLVTGCTKIEEIKEPSNPYDGTRGLWNSAIITYFLSTGLRLCVINYENKPIRGNTSFQGRGDHSAVSKLEELD